MMRNPAQTVGNLIDRQSNCFLAYIDADGFPVTKALLAPRERDGITTFWFTSTASSNKAKCLARDGRASIYFLDKRFYRGVSLIGTAEISTLPEDKERVWRDGDTMYYAGGVTDPNYCVIKFTAVKGRMYSGFKSEDFDI